MKITEFRGRFAFLSNFYISPIRIGGETYPTVEHAYQAAKFTDLNVREKIRTAETPAEAKRLGRTSPGQRPTWDSEKVAVMLALLRRKFRNRRLAARLAATGNAELVEGNNWGDTFWGVDDQKGGENHLGKLLMKVRGEIHGTLPVLTIQSFLPSTRTKSKQSHQRKANNA